MRPGALAIVAALLVSACGDDDTDTDTDRVETPPAQTQTDPPPAEGESGGEEESSPGPAGPPDAGTQFGHGADDAQREREQGE
jgi:hypothetical protein